MANIAVGQRIRELRKAKGLTQEELAERAKIGNRAVQRLELEQGNATISTISAVADALGVTAATLLQDPKDVAERAIIAHAAKADEHSMVRTLKEFQESFEIAKANIKELAARAMPIPADVVSLSQKLTPAQREIWIQLGQDLLQSAADSAQSPASPQKAR